MVAGVHSVLEMEGDHTTSASHLVDLGLYTDASNAGMGWSQEINGFIVLRKRPGRQNIST